MAIVPPPVPRAPSRPGIDPEVFIELRRLATEQVAAVTRIDNELAGVKQTLSTMGAQARTETIKVLAAAVVTCVTAVVGSRVVAPTPQATQTVIQRSAFDRALDACRALPDAPSRTACIARIVQDSAGGTP
jgi:hypothetical protein